MPNPISGKPPKADVTAHISVWSDYVCPFCYLEEPVLLQIHKDFRGRIQIEWKAFELRPEPEPTLEPSGTYLTSVWNSVVYPMAQERGMKLQLPPIQPRSRLALEAAEFARDHGRFDAMHKAIFRAFFEKGRDIGDVGVLCSLAKTVKLNATELERALLFGSYRPKVLDDEAQAAELGINSVPAMLISGDEQPSETSELVVGAQPYDVLRAAIENVWTR